MRNRWLWILVGLAFSLACNLSATVQTPYPSPASTSSATITDILPATTLPLSPTATPDPGSSEPSGAFDLLIVTPKEFLEPMRRLAEWKNSTGMPTGILTLEDAYQRCTGRDTPEKIKRCLSLYQKQSGIRFAMLVGDSDKFPIRFTTFMVVENEAATAGHIEYYPADLYYADLYSADGSFDDWDANRNGRFGEIGELTLPVPVNVDHVDLYPDISVGRVPVSTIEESQIYVDKVIRYESKALGAGWTKRILSIVTGGLAIDDCVREEKALSFFPAGWDITRLYNAGNPCHNTPAVTADDIIAEMNRGIGLVSFLGHGNMDIWGDAITVKDLSRVHNADTLPIVFSGGCNTGRFTTSPVVYPYTDINGATVGQTDIDKGFPSGPPAPAPLQVEYNNDGIMELSLVQIPNGMVIYIGSITFANFGPMFALNEYFLQGIATGQPTAGEAWNFAIRKYYQTAPLEQSAKPDPMSPLMQLRQPWIFMLFGDPSLRIGGVPKSSP
jgi:hypothetical protein